MAVRHIRSRTIGSIDSSILVNTPAKISNLSGWWCADFQRSKDNLNDGDSVTTFTDYSGKGRDFTQSTSANKPKFKANIQNGLGCMRFDGSNSYFSTLTINWNAILSFMVVVILKGQAAGFQRILETQFSSHYYFGTNSVSNGFQFIVNNGGIGNCQTGNSIVLGTPYLVGATYNGTTGIIYQNGVQLGTDTFTLPTTTSLPMKMGAATSNTPNFNGDLFEICIFDGFLLATDRIMLETYFNNKYRLLFK